MNFDLKSQNFPYLNVENGSEEIPDESCIIFAPNGSGKTTIYKILLENNKEEALGFTYDASDATYKKMEGKLKTITIDPTPINYNAIHAEAETLRDNLSTAKTIGQFFSTKKKDLQFLPHCFQEAYQSGTLKSVHPLTISQRSELKPILEHPNDVIKVIKDLDKLKKLSPQSVSNEVFSLSHRDIEAAFSLLHLEDHKEEIEKEGCPFCGGTGASGNAYNDMLARYEKYTAEKVLAFRDYELVDGCYDSAILLERINTVLYSLATLTDEQVLTLMFTKGDPTIESRLVDEIALLSETEKKEAALIAERDNKFNAMSSAYPYISSGFSEAYPGCSIELDSASKTIKVVTSRPPVTYSEGEKHDMYAKILELSILGSSKEYLLVDDPLTELDTANEYRAVFRLASISNNDNKKVIIFTCNANLVNLAVKQSGSTFKLFYLESHKDHSAAVCVRLRKMDFGPIKAGRPYLTLKHLACDPANSNDFCAKVSNVVAQRAVIDVLKPKERSVEQNRIYEEASKIMHFDFEYTSEHFGLSNSDLARFAENFTMPSCETFDKIVQTKLCLVASMRVLVEEKLFLYDRERSNRGLNSILTDVDLLAKKIETACGAKDFPIQNFYPKCERKKLMQIKTMLNDGDHPYGLINPLFFALSIGWDEYLFELNAIKALFSRS